MKPETTTEYLNRIKNNCNNGNHYYGYWIRTGENSGRSMGGTKEQLIERGQQTGTCIFCKAEF